MRILISFILSVCVFFDSYANSFPLPIADDNGNTSFVRQVVPKLLGRSPKGMLEVKLISDLIELHGREAVVRMLMEQAEFKDHWRYLLIDHLKMQRENSMDQRSICYEAPLFQSDNNVQKGSLQTDLHDSLAEFVLENNVTTQFPFAFNMHDLIDSAIDLDNMFAVYRSFLFTLGSNANSQSKTAKLFDDAYLNRDFACLQCHNSAYSTTGIGQRTHPLYEPVDAAIFSNLENNLAPEFIDSDAYDTHCFSCHGSNGTNGWVDKPILNVSVEYIQTKISGIVDMQFLDDLSFSTLEEISNALQFGPFSSNYIGTTKELHENAFRLDLFDSPDSGLGPWGMSTQCASLSLSPPGADSDAAAFFAGASSDFLSILDVDANLVSGYEKLPQAMTIQGDTAVAYLVAVKITENIWQQLMGQPLRISNRYARNNDQRNILQYLTENVFIANDWSLKETILTIVMSSYFNRQAPVSSVANSPTVLNPVFDPFKVTKADCRDDFPNRDDTDSGFQVTKTFTHDTANQRAPIEFKFNLECAYNHQGDLVHRYSPHTLFSKISSALDWPLQKVFPSSNSYPKKKFSKAIGQYASLENPGDPMVNFQALINWDDVYGACNKNSAGVAEDWIDLLIDNIGTFNTKNSGSPLTYGDLAMTIKDWLIQEPLIEGYQHNEGFFTVDTLAWSNISPTTTEASLIHQVLGASLNTPVDTDNLPINEIRQLCGVYLKSPQFMLAGLMRNDTFASPKYRVCNDDTCTYYQMCTKYKNSLSDLGFPLQCGNSSVSKPFTFNLNWFRQ